MGVTGYGRAKLPKPFRKMAQHYIRNFVWFSLFTLTLWMLHSTMVQMRQVDDIMRAYGFGSARIML